MNEFHSAEPNQSPPDPFEQLLRGCQPAGGSQLEQVLYQAGWHAAMAQVEKMAAQEKNIAIDSRLNQKAGVVVASRKATGSWNWFGSGLATGIAFSLLGGWLALSGLPMNQQPMTAGDDIRLERRIGSELNDLSHVTVAVQDPNRKQTNHNSPVILKREVSGLGWSDWFSFPSQKGVGPIIEKNEPEFAGIDWDALPPSYQKQKKIWQENQRQKANDQPRSFETLIYGRLTEAKIKELL